MITLSNGHQFQYMIASGALGFDGKGWLHEKPLIALGLIRPELFTIVIKTLTRHPRKGNLRWWKPWTCVQTIPGGIVNKVGLTNPGVDYWCDHIAPKIDFKKNNIVGSLNGTAEELVYGAQRMNEFDLVGIELNPSCPNTGHKMDEADVVAKSVQEVKKVSRHPLGTKVSAAQDYMGIERAVRSTVEWIALNSVPWEMVFPNDKSPLHRLEKEVGGGGGGVSCKKAQVFNWAAVLALTHCGTVPVVGPSATEFEDLKQLELRGAQAYGFGGIHLPDHPAWLKVWTWFTNPCKPTKFVMREAREKEEEIDYITERVQQRMNLL